MLRRIVITLLITAMFFFPLVPGNTQGDGLDDILDYTPHWREFSRDTDENGIDDIIDAGEENEYSIIINYDHEPTDQDVQDLDTLGLEVRYRSKYLPVLVVDQVTREQVRTIRYVRGVSLVEIYPDMQLMTDVSSKNVKARPTNLTDDGVKYHDVWDELGYDGTGVNIAILDTGVDDHLHETLDDMDDDMFTNDPKFIAGFYYYVGGTAVNPEDVGFTSHATHCAGIAMGTGGPNNQYMGVAPGARLVDVKVMFDLGNGAQNIVMEAMEWCIDNKDTDWENDGPVNDGIQVMSMSIGGPESNGDDAISQLANTASDEGIVVVAAMGNDGAQRVSTPAAADSVISVAATDDHNTVTRSDDTQAAYSNRGPRGDGELKPDIAAPGSGIMSAYKHTEMGYVAMDGTSMATPQIAGVVALMLQAKPELDPYRVKDVLHKSAEMRGSNHISDEEPKYDTRWGWGLVDAYMAVQMALGAPDLEVVSLVPSSDAIDEGEQMRLTATVMELNDRDAEADIEFYDVNDGDLLDTIHLSFLAGETRPVITSLFTARGGDRTFRVEVVNASPEEDDTSNNQMTHSMHINYLPEARIMEDDTDKLTYEEFTFDGSESTDEDGTVEWYYFDFGDGDNSEWQEDPETTHYYEDDGDYEVSLWVRDDLEAESSKPDKTLVTVENRAPEAGAGSDRTATENEEVEFNGNGEDQDGTIILYEWDFHGDGTFEYNSSESGDTTHSYPEEGNYTAILRVTDDDNETDTDDRVITVIEEGAPNNPPEAIISSPEDDDVYQIGESISFDGRLSFDPDSSDSLSYSWADNGHEFGTEASFTTSLDAGSHTISLQVEDGRGGADTDTVDIYVNSPPRARIKSPDDGEKYYTNDDISFDASLCSDPDDDTLSFSWYDNDDFLSDEKVFTMRLEEGNHRIELVVDDGNGATDNDAVTIDVEVPPNYDPVAMISWPHEGDEFRDTDSIIFDARNSTDQDEDPLEFSWYVDGLWKSSNARFVWDQEPDDKLDPGDHEIQVEVSDGNNGYGRAFVNITIVENRRPVARITNPKDGGVYTSGEEIDFDAAASSDADNDALSYQWKDGDQEISSAESFSRALSVGDHIITLTVDDGTGAENANHTTQIQLRVNKKPTAVISSPSDNSVVFVDEPVYFDASSSYDSDGDVVTYKWYDNGEEIDSGSTMERVLDLGDHEIMLSIRDDDGALASSTVNVRSVDHALSAFVVEESVEIKPGDSGQFTLKVKNIAEKADNVRLSASIPVEFSQESFYLEANQEKEITMSAKASEDKEIVVTAWAGQYSFHFLAKLTIAQDFGVEITTTKNAKTGTPGSSITFILVVTNTGNNDDTVIMSYETTKPWSVSIQPAEVELRAQTSKQVIVSVGVPATAAKGDSTQITITALAGDGVTKGTFVLTGSAAEATTDDTNKPSDSSDDSPGFEALGLIVALVGAALAISYRKRR